MKHSCRCGFEKHCKKLKARKLGKLGVFLVGLHLLYHVAECLILPTVLIGVSEYFAHRDSPTAAVEKAERILLASKTKYLGVVNTEILGVFGYDAAGAEVEASPGQLDNAAGRSRSALLELGNYAPLSGYSDFNK